jgi:hypothetical protein
VAGVTPSETRAGDPTVTLVELLCEPELTCIVLVPRAAAVTSPVLFTVADADDEVQVAVDVTSCVLPSEYVATASNCCVVPKGMASVCGLRVMETKAGAGTVTVVEPLTPAAVAVIVAVPCAIVAT